MVFSSTLGLVNSTRDTYTGESDIENCGREERDEEDIKQSGGRQWWLSTLEGSGAWAILRGVS